MSIEPLMSTLLVNKFSIRYALLGLILVFVWCFSLIPSLVAFLGVKPLTLYYVAIVLASCSYTLFFSTAFSPVSLVLVVVSTAFCLSMLAFGFFNLATYSIILTLTRRYKSLSVSIYESLKFAIQIAAPLIVPFMLVYFGDISVAYIVPLAASIISALPVVYILRYIELRQIESSSGGSTIGLSLIKQFLTNRRLVSSLFTISVAYPLWFFIAPYELLIGLKEGRFAPLYTSTLPVY